MGLEGGPRLMKIALIVFNILVLIAGAVTVGLGAWSLTSDYGAEDMASITGSDLYEGACILVIVGGCIVVLVSLIGCCGAFMESRGLLAFYFSALILLVVLFIVGAVIGFVYRDDLEEELEKEMTKTLKEEYGVNTDDNDYDENQGLTDVWNNIQMKLKCCGVKGGLTSKTSWQMWQESEWFKSQIQFEKDYVPTSCCNIANYTFRDCTILNNEPDMPPQINGTGVTTENPALYSNGCIDKLKDKIEDHLIAIAVAAVVVVIVTLLCTMFAICVFTQIGKQSQVV